VTNWSWGVEVRARLFSKTKHNLNIGTKLMCIQAESKINFTECADRLHTDIHYQNTITNSQEEGSDDLVILRRTCG